MDVRFLIPEKLAGVDKLPNPVYTFLRLTGITSILSINIYSQISHSILGHIF